MAIKGDFISFTYNGVHSTELGIVHVSTSDRYTDALLPTIQDKTVQVSGSDGTYCFGSYYTQRAITLSVAFDGVSESQIRLARKVLGDQLSHPLIFDEEPYKVYYAKVTGTPQYTYIPFSSPRVYKGEGTFTFTCYEPFAHTPNSNKYLSQYTVGTPSNPSYYKYDNKTEWNLGAGLLATQGSYDQFLNGKFNLYNPGDLEADFKLKIPIRATLSGIKITHNNADLESHTLLFNGPVQAKGNDVFIQFNSKTNLVEGINAQGARSGNLYNDKIGNGSWFKIPIITDTTSTWQLVINDYSLPQNEEEESEEEVNPTLEYDYLYF